MEAEIDMSGRIEETNRPTALALANDVAVCIRISAKEKRKAIEELIRLKPERTRTAIHILTFSSLVFLLIREHIEDLYLVSIDPEYQGHEKTIKDQILTLCRKHGLRVDKDQIAFKYVGKKSPAHDLAISVFRGDTQPNEDILAKQVIELHEK